MLLQYEAVGLACLSLLLAGPVPSALARARWTARSPRAALVLWQAVGLGGGLGILTAGLTLAAASLSSHWLPGLLAVPSNWSRLGPVGWLGLGLTVCVGTWLMTATATSTVRVLRARRAHRRRLDTVADAVLVGTEGARRRRRGALDVRLVDHPQAVAYCLPGFRPRVVLSRGTLAALSPAELSAVLAHEHAHARGRHDLVTQPFVAWARTFPFLPPARRAVAAVGLLVEMLADDAALRRCSPATLRGALRQVVDERFPATGPADADVLAQLDARVERLATAPRTLPRWVSVLAYGAATVLVLAPPLTLLFS